MASSSLKPRDRNRKPFRTEYQQIDLNTSTPETWFAKFLVVHSNDDTRPLSKVSPFVIAKALEQLIGKEYNAKKLGSGDIQVHVEKREQSIALLSLTSIIGISVIVSSHRSLNIVKGVISESDLLDCSESELQEGLQQHGVVAVKRIVMRRDGKEIPTKHIILCFKLHKLPDTIKAGYLSCNVRAYIPNPSRCYKCQRFGTVLRYAVGSPSVLSAPAKTIRQSRAAMIFSVPIARVTTLFTPDHVLVGRRRNRSSS
ncbi:uncharacterized protein LOC135372384 [Ornithodoros turicata]|uniref:uncharacterized protein LOC135372384 n=1 Tax=Ornithodoros turicata TaxID=34597 RepID=UPI003139CE43